ncbi:MAG: ammonia-forming cytochrome c nitrite reductase subunit c552 [Dehalobacterium sp.]
MKKLWFFLLVFCMICFAAGCAGTDNNEENPAQPGDENGGKNAENLNLSSVIYDQWKDSGHAKAEGADDPASAPGMRTEGGCFFCHNGYAFENNAKDLEGIGLLKGTSCDSCHVGYGQQVMAAGKAETPIGAVEGGKGTMCISCHNGRGKKPDLSSAPHHSVQSDIMLGKNGAEFEGVSYGNSGHTNLPDSCLSCHMAPDENGTQDHTFKMNEENIDQACNKCHDFDSFNPEAKGDYDGNGKKEGVQTEIEGLLKLVNDEILKKLNGGKFVSEHGSVVFQDKDGNAVETPPEENLYNAAWNYFFVDYDGSKGIHNPKYVVQLLQQSYKGVTGNDVTNAEVLK